VPCQIDAARQIEDERHRMALAQGVDAEPAMDVEASGAGRDLRARTELQRVMVSAM
jgi:hypothetical protein